MSSRSRPRAATSVATSVVTLPLRKRSSARSRANDTATTEIYTLSLTTLSDLGGRRIIRSEGHTSELQSHSHLVCRLLLEKKRFVCIVYSLAISLVVLRPLSASRATLALKFFLSYTRTTEISLFSPHLSLRF